MSRTRERTVQPVAKSSELEDVMKQVNKTHGECSIRSAKLLPRFNHIETGIFILDFALLGGLPEGLASMIYGYESSGKTTLIMRQVANKQSKHPGKRVVWVDTERTFDAEWALKHGVDLDQLVVAEPDTGEQAVDVIDAVMGADDVCMVVLDSIPATVPFAISDNSASDDTMSQLARLMGKLCSKILHSWSKERKRGHLVDVVFTNQFRSSFAKFGDPRMLPGGKQINFLVTSKIEMKNKEVQGNDEYQNKVVERNNHSFKITKGKIGTSIREGEFDMIIAPNHPLGQGAIDEATTIVTFAKRMGFVSGGGASWGIKGCGVSQRFNKLESIKDFLNESPAEALRLKQLLVAAQRKSKGLTPLPPDGWLLGPVYDLDIAEGIRDAQTI